MTGTNFPRVLAAVKARDKSEWEIGDALTSECGSPGKDGHQDGSRRKVVACAKFLLEQGYDDYTERYLAALREYAFKFPKNRRKISIPFSVHRVAETPDVLDAIVDGAPKGTKITTKYVVNVRQRLRRDADREHEQEMERRRKAQEDARVEAEEAEKAERKATETFRRAKDASERAEAAKQRKAANERKAAAKTKVRENRVAPRPKKDVTVPARDDVATLAIEGTAMASAARAASLAKQTKNELASVAHRFTPAAIDALIEAWMNVANGAREVVEVLRKTPRKQNHLSVVGE